MWKEVFKDFKYNKFLYRSARINLGSALIACYGFFLILLAAFIQIPVYHWGSLTSILQGNWSHIGYTLYSPQIPIVIFCVFLLGRHLGFITVILYILMGLSGLPVWASRSGLDVLYSPAFGFILGFIACTLLINNLCFKNITSIKLIFAAIFSVLSVHLFGLTYIMGLMFFEKIPFESILSWMYTLSLSTISYDLLFSIFAISVVRPVKSILWIVMD